MKKGHMFGDLALTPVEPPNRVPVEEMAFPIVTVGCEQVEGEALPGVIGEVSNGGLDVRCPLGFIGLQAYVEDARGKGIVVLRVSAGCGVKERPDGPDLHRRRPAGGSSRIRGR
jgi:hypothetical protein